MAKNDTVQMTFKVKDDGTVVIKNASAKMIDSLNKVTKQSETSSKSILSHWKKVGVGIAAVFAAKAAYGFIKSIMEVGAETENLQIRLKILTGSVEEGNRAFDEMQKLASKVPFEFIDIMKGATNLAGVVKGNVDELKKWMPLIADLAAATGFSIQDATNQVGRMLSSGAQSADMFKEHGVNAFIGFKNGVKYSAKETKKILFNSWNDLGSRWKGSTAALANTWGGVMSMISDKWRQVKQILADSGMFELMKEGLRKADDYMRILVDMVNDPNFRSSLESMVKLFGGMAGYIFDAVEAWAQWFYPSQLQEAKNQVAELTKVWSDARKELNEQQDLNQALGRTGKSAAEEIKPYKEAWRKANEELTAAKQKVQDLVRAQQSHREKLIETGKVQIKLTKDQLDAEEKITVELERQKRLKSEISALESQTDLLSTTSNKIFDLQIAIAEKTGKVYSATMLKIEQDFNGVTRELYALDAALSKTVGVMQQAKNKEGKPLYSTEEIQAYITLIGQQQQAIADLNGELTNLLITQAEIDKIQKDATRTKDEWELQTERVKIYGEESKKVLLDIVQIAESAAQQFSGGFTDAFFEFAEGTKSAKDAFMDFAASFLKSITKMIMMQMIYNAIKNSSIGGALGLKADGGVIEAGHDNKQYAKGGVVSSPTFFPMADGMGLMGEAGPEGILPLKRGSNGRLGVEFHGDKSSGGGNQTTNNNNNLTIQAMDSKSFVEFARRNPDAFAAVLNDMANKGNVGFKSSVKKAMR